MGLDAATETPSVLAARRVRRSVLGGARTLDRSGLVVGSVGNVSRRSGPRVWITPSRMPFSAMRARDLVALTLGGDVVRGRRPPSLETPLHLAIYAARPDVRAIVHTHSPYATAWSFLGAPLPELLEEQAYYDVGAVPVAAAAPAGSGALAAAAAAALGDGRAALLGRHGVVAVGDDPAAAIVIAEVVERTAHAAWLLRADGASAQHVLRARAAWRPAAHVLGSG